MKFSHRATALPGSDPATDRVVLCDGLPIGRVRVIDAGHLQAGRWQWSCYWIGTDTSGIAETLADGLNAIKARVSPAALQALPPPGPVWNRNSPPDASPDRLAVMATVAQRLTEVGRDREIVATLERMRAGNNEYFHAIAASILASKSPHADLD